MSIGLCIWTIAAAGKSAEYGTGVTFAGDVADIEAVREALGLEQRLNIYGFSYGGMVAMAYACSQIPNSVRGA